MQASKKHSFLRRSPLAYVVVPLAFVLVSTALVFIVGHTMLAPYQALLGWFFSTTEVAQPRDLLDNAATVINGGTVDEPDAQPDRLPLSSVTYPSEGDRYATITISGTNVDAPVYYGDTSKILNAGVALCADLLLRCTLCTDSFQLLHRSLTAVIYQQVSVACLQQIFCHGLAHDAKTNKTDLHFIFSFFVSFYR